MFVASPLVSIFIIKKDTYVQYVFIVNEKCCTKQGLQYPEASPNLAITAGITVYT